MATTRIISVHVNQGKTIADCLTDRIDYSKNPEKTQGGELISSYECDPKTADAEFLYSKRQYQTITGREQRHNVIAYQVRQSFKPGEITPEDANRIGYEFAERFLKGRHAFFVATHTDKKHIHNHIIWNSTTLDCKHKFRDFLCSGRAVARLSDAICTEHRLSVIADPKRGKNHYGKWLGDKAKPTHRELLCGLIDAALLQKPDGFDALLKLLAEAGCEVRRRGDTLSLRHPDRKGFIRLSSINGYSEDALRAVLAGEKEHTPRKKRTQATRKKNTLLIDIEAKLQAGKDVGYERWAKVFNVKQMAQTYNYLREHGLLDYGELEEKATTATERFHALSAQIKAAEGRMAEIAVLKTHIINYAKTRDVYAGYRKAGYSKKYLAEHEGDILLHKAAKNAFDELGVKKLPSVKSLQEEYAKLLSEKKTAYAAYRRSRDEMRELLLHKQNVDRMRLCMKPSSRRRYGMKCRPSTGKGRGSRRTTRRRSPSCSLASSSAPTVKHPFRATGRRSAARTARSKSTFPISAPVIQPPATARAHGTPSMK